MKITYSAPAKVILSGEHAVVYGKPALVSAIDLRLHFTLTESKKKASDEIILMIAKNVQNYLHMQKIIFKDKKFEFNIDSKIPLRRGLGSSAALSIAASAAFLEFYTGNEHNKETINNVGYVSEKYFHINASGVDPTTSCFGGLIFYRKEFEFLKTISALNFKIPKKFEKNLYLIDSGKSAETGGFLIHNVVGGLYNKKPQFTEQVLNDIEKVTKRVVVSIIKEDEEFFVKSMIDNEVLLEMLGIVSLKTKKMLKELEYFGYGKITGSGGVKTGSGFILFYTHKPLELEKFCKKNEINFMKFEPSYEGVKKEL